MNSLPRHWATLLGLVLLILLFLAPGLLPGKVLLPLDLVTQVWPPWQQPNQAVNVHNPLLSDVVDYIYPVKVFVAEQVKQRELPLWNPYVLGGYPLTYNTQAGLFYPLSLFYYLLPPATAVNLTIFSQLLLGAVFMFAYLRQVRLRPIAAWVGTAVFLFNGMMIVWLEWQVVHAAVIWLPLFLLCVECLKDKLNQEPGDLWRMVPETAVGALAFALPWLGGHWNWALYSSMTAVFYTLFCIFRQRQLIRRWLGTAVLLFGGGVGLSLIQVLPAFNYLRQGHRAPFSFAESLSLGLKEWAVVALVPDFFGNPIHANWWGRTNYNEIAFYAGLLPLFLTTLALALRWRHGLTRFYAAWGGVGLLWALGTPLYGLLYVLPVFDGLWPSRAMPVYLFSLAVLSAIGLDALLEEGVDGRRVRQTAVILTLLLAAIVAGYILWYRPDLGGLRPDLLWFGLSLLVCLALLWFGPTRLRPAVFAALLAGWLVLDLFWLGHDYNPVGDVADLYPQTETAVFLQSDPEPFRITTLPQGVAYPPNTALVDRLPNLSGYEPAILRNVVDYLAAAEGSDAIYFERKLMPLHGLDSPLLAALNVKYVVTIADWYQEVSTLGEVQEVNGGWAPLGGATAFAQPFRVPDAGFHRLELPLQVSDGADGTVTVRIFTADGGQELANASWELGQPLVDEWASFYFGVFPSEWGREFRFTAVYQGVGEAAVGEAGAGLAFRSYYLPRPQLVHEAGKTRIYLNDGYFPRAYVVGEALPAANVSEALGLVQMQAERLAEVVVLEVGDNPPPVWQTAVSTASQVRITENGLNRVTLQADLDDAGFVVLADTYYPGWRAAVDGRPTPLYRANSIVRAVYVPAGQHTLVFTFLPGDFLMGAAVTLFTLLLMGGLLLWTWRERRRL